MPNPSNQHSIPWRTISVQTDDSILSMDASSPEVQRFMATLRERSDIDHRDENAGITLKEAARIVIESDDDIGVTACFGADLRPGF